MDGSPASEVPRARRVAQMLATVLSAAIGGFAVSRGFSIPQLGISAFVIAGLAGAIAAPRTIGSTALYVLLGAASCVVLAAAFAGAWTAVGAAFAVALPFAITAAFVKDRPATLFNAMLATVIGATLGIGPAFAVLMAACLVALAASKMRKESMPARGFATYIASFSLVAILMNVVLSA